MSIDTLSNTTISAASTLEHYGTWIDYKRARKILRDIRNNIPTYGNKTIREDAANTAVSLLLEDLDAVLKETQALKERTD